MTGFTRLLNLIWPTTASETEINPSTVFAIYDQALEKLRRGRPTSDDPKLLDLSWQLFDKEAARRSSIDARAGILMAAPALAASLIVGVGFTTLKGLVTSTDAQTVVILVTYVLVLLYLFRTMFLVLKILGAVTRSTLGPDDVLPPATAAGAVSDYSRRVSAKIIGYTIDNYRADNVQMDRLSVAQMSFRNAIAVIIIGGLVVAGLDAYSGFFHRV